MLPIWPRYQLQILDGLSSVHMLEVRPPVKAIRVAKAGRDLAAAADPHTPVSIQRMERPLRQPGIESRHGTSGCTQETCSLHEGERGKEESIMPLPVYITV